MPRFARVAVNVPSVRDVFDYSLPVSFEQTLGAGWLVEAPFGSQMVQGIVLSLEESSSMAETKPLARILEEAPVLTRAQIELGLWLADHYFAPLSAYLFAMLPPGLGQRADMLYSLNPQAPVAEKELTSLQKKLIALLESKGPQRARQLDRVFMHVDWRAAMRSLGRQGYLISQTLLPKPAVKARHVRSVKALVGPDQIDALTDELGRPGSPAFTRRQTALRMLAQETEPVDVSWTYATGATAEDLRVLEKHGLIGFGLEEVLRDPLAGRTYASSAPPRLTADQEKAWQTIDTLLQSGRFDQPVLLHGVTGSGKTELYMRAIQKALQAGQQALVIVPEISMTPQTIERFLARFPGQVGVVHSKLSPGERYDTWRRARSGAFSIAIGPRSALFTPFPNLGVIVLDECHDDSFYQTEMGPYFHTVKAAIALGRESRSLVLLGSATPTVELYFQAKHENWPLIELPRRIRAHQDGTEAGNQPLPPAQVVDMRAELREGNTSIFSRALQGSLADVLRNKQQAILLLNRRGSASYVFCRECGQSLRCPRCDLALTYHRNPAGLFCHSCGYTRKLPEKCPHCGSPRIKQFGLGTERVEEELQAAFPNARLLRWDADTSKGKGAEEIILSHFKKHNADILIGTQMLAKGLDLPLVTLVGVVLADVGLNFPDYRTSERAFQLLTQVAGRAGRGALGGRVVIQTFQPENYAIQYAAGHDFAGFYQRELAERRRLNDPPFVRLVRFEVRDTDNQAVLRKAQGLAGRLQNALRQSANKTLSLTGPLPPYFARRNGFYRQQIILKGSRPEQILKDFDLTDIIVEVDSPSLL